MGTFIAVVINLWFFSGVLASIDFYVKKTNRSQAPIVRRFIALGYGLAWPVMVVLHFSNRGQAEAQERERLAAQRRIVGGASSPQAAPTTTTQPTPQIQNPFES